MPIVIVFKNGYELKTKCESIDIKKSGTGRVTSIIWHGITENKLIDIDFDEILCIYRVMSDELQEGEEKWVK